MDFCYNLSKKYRNLLKQVYKTKITTYKLISHYNSLFLKEHTCHNTVQNTFGTNFLTVFSIYFVAFCLTISASADQQCVQPRAQEEIYSARSGEWMFQRGSTVLGEIVRYYQELKCRSIVMEQNSKNFLTPIMYSASEYQNK